MQENQRRSYIKVTQKVRDQLVFLVLRKAMKIKEAAVLLQLKYAAAKTIVVQYKRKQRTQTSNLTSQNGRCLYKTIEKKRNPVTLISTIFGEVITTKEIF